MFTQNLKLLLNYSQNLIQKKIVNKHDFLQREILQKYIKKITQCIKKLCEDLRLLQTLVNC